MPGREAPGERPCPRASVSRGRRPGLPLLPQGKDRLSRATWSAVEGGNPGCLHLGIQALPFQMQGPLTPTPHSFPGGLWLIKEGPEFQGIFQERPPALPHLEQLPLKPLQPHPHTRTNPSFPAVVSTSLPEQFCLTHLFILPSNTYCYMYVPGSRALWGTDGHSSCPGGAYRPVRQDRLLKTEVQVSDDGGPEERAEAVGEDGEEDIRAGCGAGGGPSDEVTLKLTPGGSEKGGSCPGPGLGDIDLWNLPPAAPTSHLTRCQRSQRKFTQVENRASL